MERTRLARSGSTRLLWSMQRKNLLAALVLAVMCLALVLRFLGRAISNVLSGITATLLSVVALLSIPATVAFSMGVLVIVVRRGVDRCGCFQARKRTFSIIASFCGEPSGVLQIRGVGGGDYAISLLRLLSVPSQGVRQRIRGAVSKDEQEEGAAVSDERQYQFSHLASLFEKDGSARLNDGGRSGYEIEFKKGLVSVDFVVTARNMPECRRRLDQVEASVLSKFPVQLIGAKDDLLKQFALMGLAGAGFLGSGIEVVALDNRVASIRSGDSHRYVVVVALVGRPEMSAHEQRCQIDQFISGVNSAIDSGQSRKSGEVEVNFVVSFEPSKIPELPSDSLLRERLREKPDVRLSLAQKRIEVDAMEVEFGQRTGWWRVSAYAVVSSASPTLAETKADSVASVLRSVWSGSHFSPTCAFLRAKEVVRDFPVILRRGLLSRRYVTEMSSIRLSSLIHIPEEPHPPLSRATPPLFEAPNPETISGGGSIGVELGEVLSPSGRVLYQLCLPLNTLGTHVVVFGESGFGKTCFTINLVKRLLGGDNGESKRGIPFLVLDQKGEYRCLLSFHGAPITYFLPASRLAPLLINLFDPQGDDPDSHAKYVFNIIREILFANRTELTPQMERVLYDVLRLSVGGDWEAFNRNLTDYLKVHGEELPQLGATIQGIMNRVGQFTRPPLSNVFDCKRSNARFSYLVGRDVIIDLSELRRLGTPEDVRLVANIIAKYVSVASLKRGVEFGRGLKHLFVVDDALDVVPEILGKKTTADVGIIEYMAMLLRATGQGLVVVSQRPNISENVIANSAVKVFFRTIVDSRSVSTWVNMTEEQVAYLKVLPKQEAIIMIPQHPSPMRIRTPDVSSIVRRKVRDKEIIMNNMMNYPLMYDAQREEGQRGHEGKKEVGNKDERTKEEKPRQGQTGFDAGADDQEIERASRLDQDTRDAWSKLRGYLVDGGFAVDSDLVSSVLGVPRNLAHRVMLKLKFAGLVGFMKIPNYAHGRGVQYLYYSSRKGLFGGGVVGYVRERLHGDLTGREVVVELSPKDVPSADMVVQSRYPLVVHLATSSYKGLRLSALRERVRKVSGEFSLRKQGPQHGGEVIVVTLWGGIAQELDRVRRSGSLEGCLLVTPFSRRWAMLLADHVLHHISIETLLTGERREEREEGKEKSQKELEWRQEKEDEQGDVKRTENANAIANNECEGAGLTAKTGKVKSRRELLRENVLGLVREFGGVEPRVVVEKLSVRLPKVSEVAGELEMDGLVKVARNIPDLRNLMRPNVTFYLDAGRATALHDTVMNLVWGKNIAMGGRSRDYAFECGGKTWNTDGLLENAGGCFILEVAAGDYDGRVVEQIQAYTSQVGYIGIKGVVVVFLNRSCLEKVRGEVAGRGISLGEGFLTTLRSREEKIQFESLLLHGAATAHHKNATSS